MSNIITNPGQWKTGQSGNPKGRKPNSRTLTDVLRLKGDEPVTIGGEVTSRQDMLAKAVWQLVTTGEVWLNGRTLAAESVSEWASVVKWLYAHIEPTTARQMEEEAEIIVRVTREDKIYPSTPLLPLFAEEEQASDA